MGDARRADRTAIDARSFDGREKAPVETRVALRERAVTRVVIEIHPRVSATRSRTVLAVFGHQLTCRQTGLMSEFRQRDLQRGPRMLSHERCRIHGKPNI